MRHLKESFRTETSGFIVLSHDRIPSLGLDGWEVRALLL
jgi:hypothetical protein